MHVVMVGTGYVGLVTGTCLADVGHNVTCVDLDKHKIALLRDGKSPIFEPGLDGMIRRNIEHERLTFTTDIKQALGTADAVFIAVGTPEGEDGSADLAHVRGVATQIGKLANRDLLVIVKSTVPVGTCDIIEDIITKEMQTRRQPHTVVVASNPEFLKEGDALTDFMRPDRIVVGLKDGQGESGLRALYQPFIMDDPGRLFVMDRRSSELTKYGANAMLATRISFMNELARLCEKVGANVDNVRRGMGADPRIGRKFLYAGPGYGGSCFPKDVAALQRSGAQHGVHLSVLEAVAKANVAQIAYVSEKIRRHFGDLNGKTFAIWGLAFKPGTDDVRESPAIGVIERLLEWGAKVVGHDPQGTANFKKTFGDHARMSYVDSAYEALSAANALVLVTEWSEYKRPNWEKLGAVMQQRVVFDFRNQYESELMLKLGFHYECIGRPDAFVRV